ncbi:hypothetical protein [Paraburkholderia saeva]|uniref:Uncharacterized protein n=1 Tax=Paraburkholderia saeva TaxID=2777537 RepID=A0A9N8RRS3_9BURK|nr:hypothetical protein [Paraburkholderia saeva]CAG4886704.1 hypothetical protein R70241_00242 [Paraburkholderia saeva]CAG4887237.1 hypothetical protein LMG31841_00376 [Paraburkholderia saeva]
MSLAPLSGVNWIRKRSFVHSSYLPKLSPDTKLDSRMTVRQWIAYLLYVRQFDERCAMRLLALPASERPLEPEQVYDWLMADFQKRGEHEYADHLDSDCKATRAILGFMHRLEDAGAEACPIVAAEPPFGAPASGAANGAQPV